MILILALIPLHEAAGEGNLQIVEFLVSRGTNINVKDNDECTPLHFAAFSDNLEVAKYLVSKGANVNARDNEGETPLGVAKDEGSTAVVRYLTSLENGTRSLQTTAQSNTIASTIKPSFGNIWQAAAEGAVRDVESFIKQGVHVNAKDEHGITPLSRAANHVNLEVVKYLINIGADVNATDKGGNVLHSAITVRDSCTDNPTSRIAIIKILIEKGANVNAKGYMDMTVWKHGLRLGC